MRALTILQKFVMCCRGLVVVGSPKTLSSDGVWRSWIRWVRDHGAFLTANALPLCPWESPDDNLVGELDVSDLRPFEELDPGVCLYLHTQAIHCSQPAHSMHLFH